MCREWFKRADIEVDHVEPCGTLRTYDDLPQFVRRLFAEVDELRVLCRDCHRSRRGQ